MPETQRLPGTGLRNATRLLHIDLLLDRLVDPVRRMIERPAVLRWQRGHVANPPQSVKWKVIGDYAARHGLRVLVETGTYLGNTLYAHRKTFDTLISIELSEALHQNAVRRFRRMPHVRLLQGDSGRMLAQVVQQLEQPALFWLDGHYSAGVTAKGDTNTPIREELAAVLDHWVEGSVILIDDARAFTGENDYPSLDALQQLVAARRPSLSFAVAEDIVRVTPSLGA